MQRGRLGGYPAPAHIPNSGRWNWFHDGRPPAVIPGKGNGLAVPVLSLREGAHHTPPAPEGPPPREEAKNKS
jgi:hypothetical protein